jgi:hypothetical protein
MSAYAIPAHPVADLYPMMDEAVLVELAKDIKKNGQRELIVLHYGEGNHPVTIDGRNRLKACEIAVVEPGFRDYDPDTDGADVEAFIHSKNELRRHLDASQRAMIAAKRANMRQGERTDLPSWDGRTVSQADAAKALRVGVASVERAKTVIREGVPELAKAVESRAMPVSVAAKVAKLEPAEQRRAISQPLPRRKLFEKATPKRAKNVWDGWGSSQRIGSELLIFGELLSGGEGGLISTLSRNITAMDSPARTKVARALDFLARLDAALKKYGPETAGRARRVAPGASLL